MQSCWVEVSDVRSRCGTATRILPLVLACGITVTACGQPDAPASDPDTTGEPRTGGTLVIAGPTDLGAMNSLVSNEAYTQEIQLHALFLPLVRLDSALDYTPALAHAWEIDGDTAVVFHIRDDVRWHDGSPTSAYDVAFTFERAKDPETAFPSADYFIEWNAVEVVDSFTVRFAIDPHMDPLTGWALTAVMPRHLLDSIPPGRMANAAFNRRPIGNGPFRFVAYQGNDRWTFEANPDFPESLGGRPYVDRVVWRVIPENAAQLTELETGGADLILSPRAEQLDPLDAQPDFRRIVRPSRRYVFIGWNGRRGPLGEPRVRHALTMAIDRREILQTLRSGYGELMSGPVGPHHWAYDRALEPIPFDTAAAIAELAAAGIRDSDGDGLLDTAAGEPFAIELKIPANNAFNRDVAEMVQSDLAAIGVPLTPRPVEFSTLIGDISSADRNFDAVLMAWETDLRLGLRDVFHSAELDGPFQLASYTNPLVDSLLDAAANLTDRDAALPLWHRLQRIVRDEQPWTFLWLAPDLYLIRERIRGVEMDVRGAFVTLSDWWIDEP